MYELAIRVAAQLIFHTDVLLLRVNVLHTHSRLYFSVLFGLLISFPDRKLAFLLRTLFLVEAIAFMTVTIYLDISEECKYLLYFITIHTQYNSANRGKRILEGGHPMWRERNAGSHWYSALAFIMASLSETELLTTQGILEDHTFNIPS